MKFLGPEKLGGNHEQRLMKAKRAHTLGTFSARTNVELGLELANYNRVYENETYV